MANQTHSAITDPDIHEPKGVSTAASGRVYMSDGAGSGTWLRPMDLVATGDSVTSSGVEITGLEIYSELILVTETVNSGVDDKFFGVQLYSQSGAAYRSSATDYLTTYNSRGEDKDEDNVNFAALMVGRTYNNSRLYLTAITRISNFNHATIPTSSYSQAMALNALLTVTATVPTNEVGHVATSIATTAEINSQIKIRLIEDLTFTRFYYSLWGIR